MSTRTDRAQLIITVDAKESAAYQKTLQNSKEHLRNLKKLEVGQESYNKELNKMVALSKKLNDSDFSKLTFKQLKDRRAQLYRLRDLVPQVTFAEKGFEKELSRVNLAMKEASGRTRAVSKGMNRFGSILQALTPSMILFFAVDRVSRWFGTLLSGTAQLDQVQRRFETVFSSSAETVEAWAERSAIALGLTVEQYKKVAAASGDLLVPLGFQREEAASMSKEVIELSAALSIWEGGTRSTEEVTKILNKALLGEREQLKELGVAINEADVKARLAAKGQEKLTGEALKQAKALATLELITETSTDAIEGFAKGTNDSAQISARITARLQTWSDTLQEKLLPVVNVFLIYLEKAVVFLANMIRTLAAIPKFINDNRAAFIALGVAILSFNSGLIAAQAASLRLIAAQKLQVLWSKRSVLSFKAINAVMKANPIGFIIGLVASLVSGFILLYNQSEKVRAGIAGLGAMAKEVFNIIAESVGHFIDGWNQIKEGNITDGLKAFGQGLIKTNPLGIAFTEGERLAGAFAKGYDQKLDEEAQKLAQKKAEELAASANTTFTSTPSGTPTGNGSTGGAGNRSARAQVSPVSAIGGLGISTVSPEQTEKIKIKAEDQLAILEDAANRELDILEKKFLQALLTEQEYEEAVREAKAEALDEKLLVMASLGEQETEQYRQIELQKLRIQKEIQDKEIENTRRTEEIKQQIQQDTLKVSAEIFGEMAGLLAADEATRRKNAGAIKAFETGRVLINSFVEISEIFKSYAALGPLGQILAVAKAAAAGVRAGKAIAGIKATKFAKGDLLSGGMFQGPSHEHGGVPFALGGQIHEAEGGEAIINKRSTALFKPLLSRINAHNGWGKRFAAGDILGNAAPTGSSPDIFSRRDKEMLNVFSRLSEEIEKLPRRIDGINANVSIQSINNAQNTVNTLEQLSGF